MVNWKTLTPREVWDALMSPPKVAGPWEKGASGEMDVRRVPDGTIVATTLWVVPKHPTPWRVPIATSDRTGADAILREHGWMLVDERQGSHEDVEGVWWGVFIPAQWVKGIVASCKEVAADVASKMLRGAFGYEVLPYVPLEDGRLAAKKPWPRNKPLPAFKSHADEVAFWQEHDFDTPSSEDAWEAVPETGYPVCGEPHPTLGIGCMEKRGHTPVHEHSLDDGQKWSTELYRCAKGTPGCTSTHRFSDVCDS